MKTWEIITIVSITVIVAAVLITSVFAMGSFGFSSYGGYGGFGGIMGGGYYNTPTTYADGTPATPMNITIAETIANNYLASLNNPNLGVKEIEEYSLNYYVQYYEKSTGIGAFEMIINPHTGTITPEIGPNKMWNTKYGMMSGMMGGGIFGDYLEREQQTCQSMQLKLVLMHSSG